MLGLGPPRLMTRVTVVSRKDAGPLLIHDTRIESTVGRRRKPSICYRSYTEAEAYVSVKKNGSTSTCCAFGQTRQETPNPKLHISVTDVY